MTPVRIVLLRPQIPENVGAVARALKNFGLSDWAIVQPEREDPEASRRLAVQAGDVLDAASRPATLDEAVADCAWVVGTSSRKVRGKRRLSPREVAAEALAREGRVALVFGEERSGLSNEDLERCHDLSAIPTSDEQPSLNLAQAVMVYAYELQLARLAQGPARAPLLPVAATDAELVRLSDALAEVLSAGGFLRDGRHALRDLVAPWRRARLTRDEAAIWMAALKSVSKRRRDP